MLSSLDLLNLLGHVTYHYGILHVLPDVLNLLLFLSGKQKLYQAWLMKSLQSRTSAKEQQRSQMFCVLLWAVQPKNLRQKGGLQSQIRDCLWMFLIGC